MNDKSRSERAESERKQRLGAALRANLKRRKAQAKEKAKQGDGKKTARDER